MCDQYIARYKLIRKRCKCSKIPLRNHLKSHKTCTIVDIMNSSGDDNKARREVVRRKTARYLLKAEDIYNTYLSSDKSTSSTERWHVCILYSLSCTFMCFILLLQSCCNQVLLIEKAECVKITL